MAVNTSSPFLQQTEEDENLQQHCTNWCCLQSKATLSFLVVICIFFYLPSLTWIELFLQIWPWPISLRSKLAKFLKYSLSFSPWNKMQRKRNHTSTWQRKLNIHSEPNMVIICQCKSELFIEKKKNLWGPNTLSWPNLRRSGRAMLT